MPNDNATLKARDLSKAKVSLGKSNYKQLKKESKSWVIAAKKEAKIWTRCFSS